MGLFDPAWKAGNEEKAIAWIRACTKQDRLKAAAMEAPGLQRRIEAIQRLTDPDDMIEAAFQNLPRAMTGASADRQAWEKCREGVIDRITDREKLFELAGRDPGDTCQHLADRMQKLGFSREQIALDARVHRRMRLAALRSLQFDARKDPAAENALCRVAETLFLRIPLSVVATTAARFIRTKDVHRSFCDRFEDTGEARKNYGKYYDGGYLDVHEWEPVESEHKEIGDTRYHAKRYRCIYCGRGWLEEESYRF